MRTGLIALLAIAATYLTSPYVAVYRLGAALLQDDRGFVVSTIDWRALQHASCCTTSVGVSAAALPDTSNSLTGLHVAGYGWAFFTSPTEFAARLHMVDQAGKRKDVVLRLRLENGNWRVVGGVMASHIQIST